MNCLNSVLIEGTVSGVEKRPFTVQFTVDVKHGDDSVFVLVSATGKLADSCFKNLKYGSVVRVVGHLETWRGSLTVFAEHVEFVGLIKKSKTVA